MRWTGTDWAGDRGRQASVAMTAPERWETAVEDDGGHDLALSGLASTAGKRASRARAGTRPDQSHDHTTDRSAALIWSPTRAFYRRLPTPVLSPAGSTHEIQPGDRASSRDGPLTCCRYAASWALRPAIPPWCLW